MAYRGFEWVDVADPAMQAIAKVLADHPRMAGYYILRLIDITGLRAYFASEDRMLDAVFEHIDGRTWPPYEERVSLGSWSDQEVTAEAAQAAMVRALIGGNEIGHMIDTMNERVAIETWKRFESLFATDRRYLTGLGLGDRAYVFMPGAAIIDATRVGYLGIVEGD